MLSSGASSSGLFEFSLGVPLSQIPLARGASLLLRWLTGSLQEHELDWLLSTGQAAASAQEASALQAYMRTLRRRGLERTHWSLSAFLSQPPAANSLPAEWSRRMNEAQHRIASESRLQSPLEWGSLVPQLLQTVAWPGYRTPSSAEFQAARRWQQAVDTCGSLGFDGRHISWKDFLSALARTLDETLFAPESHDAPIQIAGPAESAGLTADAVWFLGADENACPPAAPSIPCCPSMSSATPECRTPRPSSIGIWPTPSPPACSPPRLSPRLKPNSISTPRSTSVMPAKTKESKPAPRGSQPS